MRKLLHSMFHLESKTDTNMWDKDKIIVVQNKKNILLPRFVKIIYIIIYYIYNMYNILLIKN